MGESSLATVMAGHRGNSRLPFLHAGRAVDKWTHSTVVVRVSKGISYTVYDRIDAAATINFSTPFGAATIRERHLFENGVYFVWRGYGLKKSEHKRKDSVLVLLRDSESGVRGHHQVRACKHRK